MAYDAWLHPVVRNQLKNIPTVDFVLQDVLNDVAFVSREVSHSVKQHERCVNISTLYIVTTCTNHAHICQRALLQSDPYLESIVAVNSAAIHHDQH